MGFGCDWCGAVRCASSAPFGSLMAKKRRRQSRHRQPEARSSCARNEARTHTVPLSTHTHRYFEYPHGQRQPKEEVRRVTRTNDQTSRGRFGAAVETKRCSVYSTRGDVTHPMRHGNPMRHGIPCGTVSHVAWYHMRHGIPCSMVHVALRVRELHPMQLRHGISDDAAWDLSSCTHESELPKVS